MNLLRFYIVAIMLISLGSAGGCCRWFPMADDAIFKVTGYAPLDQDCTLHLLLDGREVYTPKKVKGNFEEIYYLSFCTEKYTFEAICNGKTSLKENVKFPSKDTAQPYHLGVIAL